MLGGGTFLTQNKILPGSYINFISATSVGGNLADRGTCTIAVESDWGIDGKIFEVSNEEFMKNSKKIFGYDFTNDKLKGLRELFLYAKKVYFYRLNGGAKASNKFATAKYTGVRGNDLKIVIQASVDYPSKYNVSTLFDNKVVDVQTISAMTELKGNDYVDFKTSETIEITAGLPLLNGTNGTVTAGDHQTYLSKVESYQFNIIGCTSSDETIKSLYVAFTKRMRDEVGQKFQLVVHSKLADYEGVISVKNTVVGGTTELVYYVAGRQASTNINQSCLNKIYDGEFDIVADYSQSQLKKAVRSGEFVFHKVGEKVKVLSDINTLVTVTEEKGQVFKDNQTIRVIDQIAIDIASLFNIKYLGNFPNDKAARTSLWSDIVKHHENLQNLRAIENFEDKDISITQGDSKKDVLITDVITVVNTMAKLYMTVKIA